MERMGGDIFSERLKGGFADTEGTVMIILPRRTKGRDRLFYQLF